MTTTAPTNQPPHDNNPSTKPGTIQPHPMTHKPMVMTWTALDCWAFFGQCSFVFQAAFVKFRSSRSTSFGVRYPRAE